MTYKTLKDEELFVFMLIKLKHNIYIYIYIYIPYTIKTYESTHLNNYFEKCVFFMFQCKKHVLNNNSYKYNYYIYFSYFW